jgi:hypothetical protein
MPGPLGAFPAVPDRHVGQPGLPCVEGQAWQRHGGRRARCKGTSPAPAQKSRLRRSAPCRRVCARGPAGLPAVAQGQTIPHAFAWARLPRGSDAFPGGNGGWSRPCPSRPRRWPSVSWRAFPRNSGPPGRAACVLRQPQ